MFMVSEEQRVAFEALIPNIDRYIRSRVRRWALRAEMDDVVQDALGLAWQHWVAAAEAGKDPRTFQGTVIWRAMQSVRQGRHCHQSERERDVFTTRHSRPAGLLVALEDVARDDRDPGVDSAAWIDRWAASPARRATLRLDWTMFMATRRPLEQRVAKQLAHGERCKDIAAAEGIQPDTVGRIRRRLWRAWRRYQS